jgi:hypothetical protein
MMPREGLRHAKRDFDICFQNMNIGAIGSLCYPASKFVLPGVDRVSFGTFNGIVVCQENSILAYPFFGLCQHKVVFH